MTKVTTLEHVNIVGRRYELFIDELPVWGFVGPPPEETKDDDNIYVYTHKAFDVDYNENRVRSCVTHVN